MRILIAAAMVVGFAGVARAGCMGNCAVDAVGNLVPPQPNVTDLHTRGDTTTFSFPFTQPCCVTFAANGGQVTIDLDKGTVDLGGATVDAAASAFWDAVRVVGGRHTPQPRHYTVAEIDRMRAALTKAELPQYGGCMGDCAKVLEAQDELRNYNLEQRLRTYIAAGISPDELEK